MTKQQEKIINAQIKCAEDAENRAQKECDQVSVLLEEFGYSHYIAQRLNGDGICFICSDYGDSETEEFYSLDELIPDDEWE